MNKKRLEEIVKQEKSKVLSEAKIGPNDKFYIATKTFTADTGRITKGELYISTGKPTKVKVQGDDGPFWSTEINVEMANPNYEAFEGIDPNGFNKLFKEVDPNKDLKAMKYLSKWGLVEHGDTYYVGSWSPGRETSLEHAKTMLSKLKKVSSESPNQAVLKIAGYKGSMIDIARGITVVRKWADMYEIVFDDKTKSISPQKLVNLLKKGGYTRHGKQVQLLKAGMNEASIKKKKGVELTYGQAISTKDIDKSIEKHIEKNYPKDHNPGVSRFHGGGKVGMTGKQGHGLKPANIMAIQKFAKKNNDKKLLGLIDEWIKVAKANDIIEGKVNEGKYNVGEITEEQMKTRLGITEGKTIKVATYGPKMATKGINDIKDIIYKKLGMDWVFKTSYSPTFDESNRKSKIDKQIEKQYNPSTSERTQTFKIVESVNEDLPTKEIDPKEFPNPLPSSKKGFLKKGDPKNDGGKADDDVVPTKDVQIAVSKLKPSQDAIYLGKTLAMAIGGVEGGDLGAVISKDNYILDGHHRYAATSFNNPNASVGGVRANLNIGDLIPVLRAVGDAMKNKRGVEPKGGDVNIFKATMDDIKNVIYKGKNVPAQYYDKEKSIAWFEAIGEDVLSKRLKQLQSKRPPAGAPMRKDMPKIRPGQINLLKALLNKGKIDVREPYAENVNEANFAHSKGGQIEVGKDYIYTIGKKKTTIKIKDIDHKKGVKYYDFSTREYMIIPISTWNSLKRGHYMTPIKESVNEATITFKKHSEINIYPDMSSDGHFPTPYKKGDTEKVKKIKDKGRHYEVYFMDGDFAKIDKDLIIVKESVNNETINRIINEEVDKFVSELNEGKWTKIMKNARELNVGGTWTVIANDVNKRKVVGQYPTKIMAMIPALYEKAKKEHPGAKITVENGQGKSFVAESVNEAQDKFKVIDTKTGETIEVGLPKRIAQKLATKKKEWTSYPDREKSAIAKIAMSEESVNEVFIDLPRIPGFIFAMTFGATFIWLVWELVVSGIESSKIRNKLSPAGWIKLIKIFLKKSKTKKIMNKLSQDPEIKSMIDNVKRGKEKSWKLKTLLNKKMSTQQKDIVKSEFDYVIRYDAVVQKLLNKESVNENGIMYKAGVKKYGKEGMTKIQSAAGKDLGHEEIGKIKDKYEKGKKGKNEAIEEDLGSVGGMSIPTIVSSLFALYVMFKIAYTTNADVQELKKLGKAILMRVPILGPKLAKKDFVKGLDTIFKTADMSKIESYLTKNPKLSKIIGQIKGGDRLAWKKLYGELKDMDYRAYSQSHKIISKFYQSLKPSKKK